MRVFGYNKDCEELIELQEVSFLSNIEELEKIIRFLQDKKEQHIKVTNETDLYHSHFRDWDIAWKDGSVDIIIATTNNK